MKHSDVAGKHGFTTMNNVRRINVLVAGTGASSLIRYLTLHNVQNKALGSTIINRARYYLQEAKKGIIQKNEDGVYDLCMMNIENGSINDADGLMLVVPVCLQPLILLTTLLFNYCRLLLRVMASFVRMRPLGHFCYLFCSCSIFPVIIYLCNTFEYAA